MATFSATATGYATVEAVKVDQNLGDIAGVLVTDGQAEATATVDIQKATGPAGKKGLKVVGLRRFQAQPTTVAAGLRCGVLLGNSSGVAVGDTLAFHGAVAVNEYGFAE